MTNEIDRSGIAFNAHYLFTLYLGCHHKSLKLILRLLPILLLKIST